MSPQLRNSAGALSRICSKSRQCCSKAPSQNRDAGPLVAELTGCRLITNNRALPPQEFPHHDRCQSAWLFDACHSCRCRPRRYDRRPRDADLSDGRLRVQRCRSRGLAVRSAGVRQYLHPHRQSDPGRARAAHRRAGRRHRRARGCLGPCGAADHVSHPARNRRRVRRGPAALWRLDQSVQSCFQEIRLDREVGRRPRPRRASKRRSHRRPRRS